MAPFYELLEAVLLEAVLLEVGRDRSPGETEVEPAAEGEVQRVWK